MQFCPDARHASVLRGAFHVSSVNGNVEPAHTHIFFVPPPPRPRNIRKCGQVLFSQHQHLKVLLSLSRVKSARALMKWQWPNDLYFSSFQWGWGLLSDVPIISPPHFLILCLVWGDVCHGCPLGEGVTGRSESASDCDHYFWDCGSALFAVF